MDITIWAAMIIPIIAIIWIVAVPSLREKFVLWEYAALIGIPFICVVASYYAQLNSSTTDKEFYNHQIISVKHSERWNEYIHKTCSRENCSGSGKDRRCTTTYYDCSYVDDHPEYWSSNSNTGRSFAISREKYSQITGMWKTEGLSHRHRGCHTICGNVYVAKYPNDPGFEKAFSITTEHSYKNKVQASTSVYNFRPIDTGTVRAEGLYEYPKIQSNWDGVAPNSYTAVLGDRSKWANHKLISANALYGSQKQLHMMLLVFHNKPYSVALTQEAYWKGGNKNEFILMVGVNDGKIEWSHVTSWTPSIKLKKDIERKAREMKSYNPVGLVDMMVHDVPSGWARKEFKDFEALQVDIPVGWTVFTYIMAIIVTIGIFLFGLLNNVTNRMSKANNHPYSDYLRTRMGNIHKRRI